MSFCKICGSEVSDQDAFCGTCGATISNSDPNAAPAVESVSDFPSESKSNSNSLYKSYKSDFSSDSTSVKETVYQPESSPETEPVHTPAPESVYAPPAEPVSAPPVMTYASAPTNIKVCPTCGNQCNENAVICVNCGQKLTAESNKSGISNATKSNNKALSVVSIVIIAIGLLSTLSFAINSGFTLSTAITLVASILILVGFIKGKCNKLPGIGYVLSALSSVVALIDTGDFSLSLVVAIIQAGVMAALYLGTDSIRKLWFIPVVLSVINIISSYAPTLEYIEYFGFESIVSMFISVITALISSVIVCLNAKINWNTSEVTAENPTQY